MSSKEEFDERRRCARVVMVMILSAIPKCERVPGQRRVDSSEPPAGYNGGEGGGLYPCVACPSHLTTDHASRSRPSIASTPWRDLQHLGADYVFSMHGKKNKILHVSSPFCFAICGG